MWPIRSLRGGERSELGEKSQSFFRFFRSFRNREPNFRAPAVRIHAFAPGELMLNQNAQGLFDPDRILMPTEDPAYVRTRRSLRVGAQVLENLVRHGVASRAAEDREHRSLAITPDLERSLQVRLRDNLVRSSRA